MSDQHCSVIDEYTLPQLMELYRKSIVYFLGPHSNCDHEWEVRALFTSHYSVCKKCGEEQEKC